MDVGLLALRSIWLAALCGRTVIDCLEKDGIDAQKFLSS